MSQTQRAIYRLQPMTFLLRENCQVKHTLWFLAIPKEFREVLNRLNQHLQVNRAGDKASAHTETRYNIPVASLNAALLALFPEIITIEPYATKEGKNWIIAERPINQEHFQDVIKSWMFTEFLKVHESSLFQKAFDLIEETGWFWGKKTVDFNNFGFYENGTTQLENNYFTAVPDYICQRLSREGVRLSFGSEERALFRISKEPNGKSELISWPPFEFITLKGKKYYYSLGFKFSVETIPHAKRPLINMSISTKRYISQSMVQEDGKISLPWSKKTSVLLNVPPYWQESGNIQSLSRAEFGINKDSHAVEWADKLSEILNRLSWQVHLPSAQEVALKPEEFLGSSGISLGMIHHNALHKRHPVGTGCGLLDKNELFRQVADLIPELEPIRCLDRVRKGMRENLLQKSWKETPQEQRRLGLSEITGGEVTIEVLYDSESVRQALKENVLKIWGFENMMSDKETYRSPQLILHLKEIPIGELGWKLEIAEGKKKREAMRDAIGKRINQVQQFIKSAPSPTGTLVELGGKEDFKDIEDPKRALRKGLAKTGRITQFIEREYTSESKKKKDKEATLKNRAESAVLDLLRQFGYLPESFTFKFTGRKQMDEPLDIFAFWLIRTNSKIQQKQNALPLVLHMQSGSREIMARYPGSQGWYPYSKILLGLGQLDTGSNSKLPDTDIAGFIQKIWQEDIIPSPNSLVLVDGYNLRSKWSWLADKNIDPSRMWISDRGFGWNSSDISKTRFVRIRANDDVPHGFGVTDDGALGLTSGVFAVEQNVFYAVAPKPRTMMKYGNEIAKIRRTIRPDIDHRQPGFVEIFPVILQPEDDPATWATLVHKMRQMIPSYDDFTIHPLPIHLLKKADEYLSAFE